MRRPRDSVACVVMVAVLTAIIVNATYLQHGRHPAPIFALRPLPVASAATDVVGVVARPGPEAARHENSVRPAAEGARAAPPAGAAGRKDVIAELLTTRQPPAEPQPQHQSQHQAAIQPPRPVVPPPGPPRPQPSRQVLAVQRALSEFGYGQLRPTGVFDAETRAAVQRFEREHGLPVSDDLTEPTKRALANLVGRPLD